MEITPLAPPSVQLVPAKEYNGAPIGTSYDVRAYVGEWKDLLILLFFLPSTPEPDKRTLIKRAEDNRERWYESKTQLECDARQNKKLRGQYTPNFQELFLSVNEVSLSKDGRLIKWL